MTDAGRQEIATPNYPAPFLPPYTPAAMATRSLAITGAAQPVFKDFDEEPFRNAVNGDVHYGRLRRRTTRRGCDRTRNARSTGSTCSTPTVKTLKL